MAMKLLSTASRPLIGTPGLATNMGASSSPDRELLIPDVKEGKRSRVVGHGPIG